MISCNTQMVLFTLADVSIETLSREKSLPRLLCNKKDTDFYRLLRKLKFMHKNESTLKVKGQDVMS